MSPFDTGEFFSNIRDLYKPSSGYTRGLFFRVSGLTTFLNLAPIGSSGSLGLFSDVSRFQIYDLLWISLSDVDGLSRPDAHNPLGEKSSGAYRGHTPFHRVMRLDWDKSRLLALGAVIDL